MKYICIYCKSASDDYDTHTCSQCTVSRGDSPQYMNYTMYVKGIFYCLQFRYYDTPDRTVLRIGDNSLISFKEHLKLAPEDFKSFIESNKVKTYRIFS